jgi:RHS repeat-associated protein
VSAARRGISALPLIALAAFGCTTPPQAADEVETRRSDLNTNVTVTVVNTGGTAQSGTIVYVKKSTGSGFLTSGTTNAQGHVTFSLANGSYKFANAGYGDNFYFWSSTTFSCTTPSCTSATITITAPITVTVLDTDGTPQTGATVFAEKNNGTDVNDATVDANGHAVISVNTGSYRFSTPGVPSGFNYYSGASGSCVVAGCTTASITVQKPVAITLIDGDGNPVAGEEIDAINANGDPDNMGTTDSQGHVSISVDPGTYHFRETYGGAYFESSACAVPGCTSATVQIMKPVQVTVTDGYGSPRPDEDVLGIDTNDNQVNWVTTDSTGQALLYLPPGSYTVRTIDGNMYFDGRSLCQIPGCTIASLEVTDVVVTVTDSNGNPVSGLTVKAVDAAEDEIQWIDTDANGQADLYIPLGAYKFRVVVDGNYIESGVDGHCQVTGCRTASITIPAPVVVTVVDASNQPIANQQVTAEPENCELPTVTGTTNAQGHVSFTLSPGGWRFKASCGQETFYSGNAGSCAVGSGCTTAQITMRCNTCAGQPNGHACNDGNPCTQTDTCSSGVCVGSNPVTCTASDQCHVAGTCDVNTGVCSNPPKADGSVCTDGNACTQSDTCQSGACVGSDPVVCVAQDQCHDPGACNTGTGLCSTPAKANGSPCNDDNACTQTDTCQSGTCTGSNPVTCTASDSCHDVGTCAPLSGQCSNPAKPAGTPCGGSATCTASGQCVSNNQPPVVNAGADQTVDLQQPKPGPTFTLQHISTSFNAPVGIEYHPILNKMVMSMNCCDGHPNNFEAINADGTHAPFTTISGLTDEVYFAIARDEGGGHNIGGFVTGEMYVGTGSPGVIARVSPDGSTIDNPWVTLPGETGLLRGQLQFDRTGLYGGDLLVTTTAGNLWRVTVGGSATRVATGLVGADLEGLTAVPNDPNRYGPWAGKILIGDENVDAVYAVDGTGAITTYQLGVRPENISVVPPGENFYGVDFNNNSVYGASASQFRSMVGDILITEEFTGDVWHVRWNGTAFEKTQLAQVSLWEHTTFGPAALAELTASNAEVALSGTASDDGHPTGTLTTTWSVVSGPGSVTFGDSHALSTTATFIEEGTYVLALTASDGELTTSDQVTITIRLITPHNTAPVVDAGPDDTVQLPAAVHLAGSATDDGLPIGSSIALAWTMVSGPSEPIFINPTVGFAGVLFVQPGTYVLRLTGSDGELTGSDDVTITVNPEPSLDGGNLVVHPGNAGPITIGNVNTATATLTNASNQPIPHFPVQLTITGANPMIQTLDTDDTGTVSFAWRGIKAGTDTIHATALGIGTTFDSASVSVAWTDVPIGGPVLTQGWIASPVQETRVTSLVPIVLASDVTLTAGTILYWPATKPSELHTLATGLSGAPGAQIATLDTTTLANDVYVIHLDGTSSEGEQKASEVLVTVAGDYKPGRVVIENIDFQVPIAGLPITIGRRYDSLEKDKVGDFGHGWSLMIGHPRIEQGPDYSVTLTLPNGRRTTFFLQVAMSPEQALAGNLNPFPGVLFPSYVGEPGEYGTLTQEGGCPAVRYNGGDPTNPITCFFTFGFVPDNRYAPEVFTYTDPYGTAYRMTKAGVLQTVTDRQGNQLTFSDDGITSNSGKSLTFHRDPEGRITFVDYPAYFTNGEHASTYEYDPNGDLVTAQLAAGTDQLLRFWRYDYGDDGQHLLQTSTDPNGNAARTSTYYPDGRLETDQLPIPAPNTTTYTYDLANRITTTTYPDSGVLTQTFDPRGLLLTEKDQRGHTTQHEYDDNRNETSRTNALGEVTITTYDRGNPTFVTDPLGTTHTTYGDDNLPTTFTDRLGNVTTIDYDPDLHVPARIFDAVGTRFRFTNNDHGLPVDIEDAAGNVAHLEYDAAGNVTTRTDWLGRTTQAHYDEAGHALTETTARGGLTTNVYTFDGKQIFATDAVGRVRETIHDPNGNLVSDFDNVGHDVTITPDALNQVAQLLYSNGQSVHYTRDFRGNPLSMTDENGHTTTYEYDRKGNLTKTTFPDDDAIPDNNPFTTRTYDALDRLASVTDENGHTTTYQYQPGCGCSDRVTVVMDPVAQAIGKATVTEYDKNGRQASITDANGHKTKFEYDVRGHRTDTHYPDLTSTHEEYDTRGRRTSMTIGLSTDDLVGKTTHYGYDDQGQLTSVTDPLSHVTRYTYDLDGNLASVTDANNHTTSYEYDLMGRKTKRTLPLGQFEKFGYDLGGRQTQYTEFRSTDTDCQTDPTVCTQMTYDSRDRMMSKVPAPYRGEPSQGYTYSGTGKRLTATKGTDTTSYTYDARDRLHTKAMPLAGTLTYGYDPAGNVTTIVSSNTNGTNVEYTWDAANQLASVIDHAAGGTTTAAYTYTATRRPDTLTQTNSVVVKYSYDDPMDRVTSMAWRHGTSSPFATWAYTYNDRGQRLSSTETITGRSAAYGYDDASRLTSETITGDPGGASFNGALSYSLDGGGNRLSRTSTLAALGAQTFTYNANDEISGDSVDLNGNTIASDGHTYAYDFENRLVSKDADAVTIKYDCDGNRVAKTVGGVTTRYLVDDLNPTGYLQVLEEVVGGAVQTRYTYGTRVVSQTRDLSGTPATSYYGYDAHGNITFLTDASGVAIDSYDYDAWGNVVVSTGSAPNTRLYVGEELDTDLGLLNLRARLYRATAGRFMTIDPLGVAARGASLDAKLGIAVATAIHYRLRTSPDLAIQALMPSPNLPIGTISQNRYLYARSDPLTFIDPSGLADTIALYSGWAAAALAVTQTLTRTVLPALVKTAILLAVSLEINKIVNRVKERLKKYEKLGDWARCWMRVEEFLRTALKKLEEGTEKGGPELAHDIIDLELQAEDILEECLAERSN